MHRNQSKLISALDDLGAIPTANSSREQFMISLDVLRSSLPEAFELLAELLLRPVYGEQLIV